MELPTRGGIHDLSKRSRLRCAWALSNAPEDWGAMAVLTFREQPAEPKLALKKFVRSFRLQFGPHVQWSWVMEWQSRGVIHFHLFFSQPFLDSLGDSLGNCEHVIRRGKPKRIMRGFLDEWLVRKWCACVGDNHPDFLAFQRGGIIELLDKKDAAGRYVAREAGKRSQKRLPEGVSAAGRWWWISPAGKPVPGRTIVVKNYPWPTAYRLIFDVAAMERTRQRITPLVLTNVLT